MGDGLETFSKHSVRGHCMEGGGGGKGILSSCSPFWFFISLGVSFLFVNLQVGLIAQGI